MRADLGVTWRIEARKRQGIGAMGGAAIALALAFALPAPAVAQAFSFDSLRARARELSKRGWEKPRFDDLPEWLAKIDYDGYRKLRFRPEMALWAGDRLPFSAHFLHRGFFFKRRVAISVVDGSEVNELRFSTDQFDYHEVKDSPVLGNLGYAGFALRCHLDRTDRWDEFAVFQGASYFRLVAAGQGYGASARGLAIDTAAPRGEEFPEFVEFWLEKPKPGASALTLYALLDSPSTVGAFRFSITPGTRTAAVVSAFLYPRHGVEKFGLAPLTSMFLLGEARSREIADWRPEVHDSDGLLVAGADGSWLWRPLDNPERSHRVTRLPIESPAGFGLLQRDRNFESYQDLESRFEKRPSYWVEPRGAWGKGAIELVEIPSDLETNDNVVAYWVPEKAPGPGEELAVEYALIAFTHDADKPPLARATSTRVRPGKELQLFVVDFQGAPLAGAPADLQADVAPTRGKVRHVVLQPNEPAGGQRCSFEWLDAAPEPAEIRVTLRQGARPVSETVVIPWGKP